MMKIPFAFFFSSYAKALWVPTSGKTREFASHRGSCQLSLEGTAAVCEVPFLGALEVCVCEIHKRLMVLGWFVLENGWGVLPWPAGKGWEEQWEESLPTLLSSTSPLLPSGRQACQRVEAEAVTCFRSSNCALCCLEPAVFAGGD